MVEYTVIINWSLSFVYGDLSWYDFLQKVEHYFSLSRTGHKSSVNMFGVCASL